ncbi:MAG: helix-turn-helix domain-containing protein [Planctomycetota bacterium]|nr:helix-turn-helix domain-containing protein [Planctomycetota bacterium]
MATEASNGDRFIFENTEDCPIRDVVARFGDKWSIIVLLALSKGSERFNALKRRIVGVSQRMLTRTLRQLEREGYVSRVVHAEVPVRVEYSLTELGQDLIKPLWALIGWAREHHDTIREARDGFDGRE